MNLLNAKKNIFVVVMTHNREVANECASNGGQRVKPIPGFYTGEKESPVWKEPPWSRDLLVGAIRFENPGEFEEDEQCAFVKEGITPLEAVQQANNELRLRNVTGEAPIASSRRRKRARTQE